MTTEFRGYDYLQSMARRLVYDFGEASAAGHPGLIGSARETPARLQLERVLPGNFGVGSGIVIDSFGGKSKQQDIIVYEKHLCPVFSINDTAEATYYPIEGVMAVGEVKSSLDKDKLEDSFNKIASVKSLRRIVEPETDQLFGLPSTVPFRNYGSTSLLSGAESEQYKIENSLDQVFGFILAGDSSLKAETLVDHAVNFAGAIPRHFAPNVIVSLAVGHISWLKSANNSLCRSAMEADMLAFSPDSAAAFPWLIYLLRLYAEAGRTVSLRHYRRYFENPDNAGHQIGYRKMVSWA